jgi:coenzyme F420 hydrogenase subunit beta
MQKYNSIKIITDNNLCISCGACTHICPFNTINMQYSEFRGKWDAYINNPDVCLQCNGEKNCLYVCPSYDTDYTLFGSQANNFIGNVENIYNGYSINNKTRQESSSGGFIRELCNGLLKNKMIDGVISITHDHELDYTPKLLTSIDEMPNSIYHNINFENAFEVLKKVNGKFLIIGLPCQLMGIELLLKKKKFSKLKEKVQGTVALICGYTFPRTNLNFFAYSHGLNLKTMSYRENGRYRKTRISTDSKSVLFDIKNPASINEKLNNMIMFDSSLAQDNCLLCVDHLGYCADLSIGDAWQKKYISDSSGTNIIIVRTSNGNDMLQYLNNFHLEDGNENEIFESQGKYAEPYYGLAYAQELNKNYIPKHHLGNNLVKAPMNILFKEKMKTIVVKTLFSKKHYTIAKAIYIALEYKLLLKLIGKKILGKKL